MIGHFPSFIASRSFIVRQQNQIRSLPVENTPAKRATNRALS
jgi:hypothetical protein